MKMSNENISKISNILAEEYGVDMLIAHKTAKSMINGAENALISLGLIKDEEPASDKVTRIERKK